MTTLARTALFGVEPLEITIAASCALAVLAVATVAALVASRPVTDPNFARYLREQ
jgi:hypothetical protein